VDESDNWLHEGREEPARAGSSLSSRIGSPATSSFFDRTGHDTGALPILSYVEATAFAMSRLEKTPTALRPPLSVTITCGPNRDRWFVCGVSRRDTIELSSRMTEDNVSIGDDD
jgi:hypothetical protein